MKFNKNCPPASEVLVRCRPGMAIVVAGALMGFFFLSGAILGQARTAADYWARAASVLLSAVVVLVPAWHVLGTQIAATERGLRWRRMLGGWRSADWDQVTDYYRGTSKKGGSAYRVETASGLVTFDSDSKNAAVLAEVIRERATSARASEWGFHGTRLIDSWPREFSYDTPKMRRHSKWLVAIGIVLLPPWGWFLTHLPAGFDLAWEASDPKLRFMLAFGMATPLFIPVVLIWYAWRDWTRMTPFEGESILVTPDILEWHGDGASVTARWSEITEIVPGNSGRQEVVFRGTEVRIPVSHHAEFFPWVLLLAKTFAPHLHGIGHSIELGPVTQESDTGQQLIYSLRSRGTFGFPLFVSTLHVYFMLFLLVVFVPMQEPEHLPPPPAPPPLWIGLLLAALSTTLLAAVLWSYSKSHLVLDQEAIEIAVPWKRRRVRFEHLKAWGETKKGLWINDGHETHLLEPGLFVVANREHLRGELEKRLPGLEFRAEAESHGSDGK